MPGISGRPKQGEEQRGGEGTRIGEGEEEGGRMARLLTETFSDFCVKECEKESGKTEERGGRARGCDAPQGEASLGEFGDAKGVIKGKVKRVHFKNIGNATRP